MRAATCKREMRAKFKLLNQFFSRTYDLVQRQKDDQRFFHEKFSASESFGVKMPSGNGLSGGRFLLKGPENYSSLKRYKIEKEYCCSGREIETQGEKD